MGNLFGYLNRFGAAALVAIGSFHAGEASEFSNWEQFPGRPTQVCRAPTRAEICLACIGYFEAGNQTPVGKLAIMRTAITRLVGYRQSGLPRSGICAVIREPWQFAYFYPHSYEKEPWLETLRLVVEAEHLGANGFWFYNSTGQLGAKGTETCQNPRIIQIPHVRGAHYFYRCGPSLNLGVVNKSVPEGAGADPL